MWCGVVRLSGDVESFREVYRFMTGDKCSMLGDDPSLRFILDVKRDADYYGVVGLVPLCDQMAFLKLQSWCTKILPSLKMCSMWEVIQSSLYPSLIQGEVIILVQSTRRFWTRGPIIFAALGPLRATRKDLVTLRFLMVSEVESQRNVKVFSIEGISYGMSQLLLCHSYQVRCERLRTF